MSNSLTKIFLCSAPCEGAIISRILVTLEFRPPGGVSIKIYPYDYKVRGGCKSNGMTNMHLAFRQVLECKCMQAKSILIESERM